MQNKGLQFSSCKQVAQTLSLVCPTITMGTKLFSQDGASYEPSHSLTTSSSSSRLSCETTGKQLENSA